MYKKISGIYAIVNMVNWKKYVGQAIDMKSRNSKELSELRNNKFHNQHLQHAWNKHGEENFVFIFLEECIEEKLDEREIYHVNAAGWPNHDLCYNLNEGGKSGGRQHPESNKKRSETLKGIETWNKGKKCPNISKANKGREPWNKGKKCHQLAGENNGMYGLTGEDHPMGGKTAWNKGKKRSKKSRSKQSETVKGENHPNTNLTARNVQDIRYILITMTYYGAVKDIASLYNVKPAVITKIKNNESWKDVKIGDYKDLF